MTYQEVLENARKTILNCKVCPECNGLGFVQQVDPDLLIPDQSLSIVEITTEFV